MDPFSRIPEFCRRCHSLVFSVSRECVNRDAFVVSRLNLRKKVLLEARSIGDGPAQAEFTYVQKVRAVPSRQLCARARAFLTVRRIYGVREGITFAYQFLLHIKVHQRR